MWQAILHWTGVDTQQSYFYDFWSGIGPVIFGQLPILISLLLYFRHHNCHIKGCWRLGHPDPRGGGFPACKRHHSLYQQSYSHQGRP